MAVIYSDYARDRIGWFFGVSGWQLGVLVVAVVPLLWAVNAGAWLAAGAFLALWLAVLVVTVVPVRGRSATGWLVAATCYAAGTAVGWTRFRSRAATGRVADLDEVDLPGVLAGVQIHDGPPHGPGAEADRGHPAPREADVGGHRGPDPSRDRDERGSGAAPPRDRPGGPARYRVADRAGRRGAVPGPDGPRGRRRPGGVGRPAPPPRRPGPGPGDER